MFYTRRTEMDGISFDYGENQRIITDKKKLITHIELVHAQIVHFARKNVVINYG